ncbi:MAG: DoxX family protein [Bacteroidota bacterium]
MKRTNLIYWILTGLSAALMVFSSIPNILSVPQAVDLVITHLGYPTYFLPFVGVAKLLGAIAILIPGFPRIKEWAYAGLIYDLVAAIYSGISVGDPASAWLPIFVPIILITASYIFYHKKLKEAELSRK